MNRKRIVILGSNLAGFTAALALKDLVHSRHDVTVISRHDQFVFHPSLIRIPLGARTPAQAAFSIRAQLSEQGIAFREEPAVRLDLARRRVVTPTTEERYDFLVIATGAKPNFGAVPGLGPRGYTQSILSLAEAEQARRAFQTFLQSPGPIVVGDVQGCQCRRPGLEFLLNVAQTLEARGLAGAAPLTYLTSGPAPFTGNEVLADSAVAQISPGQIQLTTGRALPFAYAMLLPSFLGVDVVRACSQITDAAGFVRVNGFLHTEGFPEVFAAGGAVAGEPPEKSGELAEQMARTVARNIAACIDGHPMVPGPAEPIDVRSAASLAQRSIGSDAGWLIPGTEAWWAPVAFNRFFPAGA